MEASQGHDLMLCENESVALDSAAERTTVWTPAAVALLTGFVVGWLGAAVSAVFSSFVGEVPSGGRLVPAGCLLALAIGPHLPRRLAGALARVLLHRRTSSQPLDLANGHNRDWRLLWITLAAAAMAAGLSVAAMPLLINIGRSCHGFAMEHFFWQPVPLSIFVFLLAFSVGLIPFSLIGFQLMCTIHIARRDGRSVPSVAAWLLLGAGSGVAGASGLATRPLPAALLVVIASLPLFVLAIAAVHRSHFALSGARDTPDPLPSNRRQVGVVRLRMASALCAMSLCGALPVWLSPWTNAQLPPLFTGAGLTLMLWTIALGAGVASARCRSGYATTSGASHAMLLAGFLHLAGGTWMVGPRIAESQPFLLVGFAVAAIFTTAYALTLGYHAILVRSRDSAADRRILAQIAWAPAAALIALSAAGAAAARPLAALPIVGAALMLSGMVMLSVDLTRVATGRGHLLRPVDPATNDR